ncbi:MAG: hypothetical protein ABL919_00700 [Methylococcales bacterium]|nr:hypothetical protein [Methylococcaceae bacterium]
MKIPSSLQPTLDYLRRKPFESAIYLIAAVMLLKLGSLYFGVTVDDNDWDQYKIDHHCQTQTDSQNSSWRCDDGKTYYRWRQQR